MKSLIVLILVLVIFMPVFAQVRVSHRFVNDNALEVFFLKDFDINTPSTGPPIFFIDIQNDATQRLVILNLTISSREHGNLSRGETRPFPLSPNQLLSLTNNHLFSNVGEYRFDRYQIADNVVKRLLRDVLSTGKLPSDIYQFEVVVRDAQQNALLDSDQFDIRVTNPKKVDLIFPGHPATGRRHDCQEIFTNLPQFRWESRMKRFLVTVAEARPGEDPENVLNQQPRFRRLFVLHDRTGLDASSTGADFSARVQRIPATSFQYPATGEILTLRPGKTYFWRASGIVETSSGPMEIKSEIYCFRIAKLDEMGNRKQQFEFILRNIMGSDFDDLFGEGGELEGYIPKQFVLDGETVSFAELVRKLKDLSANYKGYRIE